ncbi:PHP domain-containing protein [Vibrio parahaemolyticus]|nr:PHP domain-containing protein [Vibrio parahaemolyticus]
MKKIDLHLHTVHTESDPWFEYSLDSLKKYVEVSKLDCIAITNHNVFDLEQFSEIKREIDAIVFPGIEIDLDGGHMLLISEGDDLVDFDMRCKEVTKRVNYPHPNISLEEFKEIFPNLKKYILIPHYDKSPKITKYILDKLSDFITAGEVQSPKKFIQQYKEEGSLVPVLFSDLRMKLGLTEFESRATYINLESLDFRNLKIALTKKSFVSLSEQEGNDFFNVMDSGIRLSTGLNVILGKRSSGKSYTLEKIKKSSGEDAVKFIRQFELLENNEERDKKEFDDAVSKNQSEFTERYLSRFKSVVDDVHRINLKNDENEVELFLSSLLENAHNQARKDIYSKAILFSEHVFLEKELNVLEKLISSVQNIIKNTEYAELIERSVSRESLISLHTSLINQYKFDVLANKKMQLVNDMVTKIKSELSYKTSHKTIDSINFRKLALNKAKAKKFNEIVMAIREKKRIGTKELYGYSVVAERDKFSGASDLKTVFKGRNSLQDAYKYYEEPFNYINKLKEAGIEDVELYKLFTKVSYRILNKYGTTVSGGERSEYRLLKSLHDAKDYDILLIDEPESSFDNVFLFESVNKIIKDLSKQMPVVVVTHNNTVGASIEPDYILYTEKNVIKESLEYNVYFGHPTDTYLTTHDGKTVKNYNIQLDSLEAGQKPYDNRGQDYANLKN